MYYFIEISDFHEEAGLPVPMAEKACKIGKKEGPHVSKDIRALIYLGFIPEVRLPNYLSGAVILFPFLGNCCGIPASCSFAFHI